MRARTRALAMAVLLPLALGGCVVAAGVGPPVVTGYGYYGPVHPRPYVYRPVPYGHYVPRYRPYHGPRWGYARPWGYGPPPGHWRRW